MGKRGPAPDPSQAARGFPGRRRRKAIKDAVSAERVAELLAPVADAVADVPAMLRDPKYAAAAIVWRKLAPELRRTHRLPAESEHWLVMACIYAQEWTAATEDLHENGFTQEVQTVKGGIMERRRPKTFDRQQAYSNLNELSVKFGLTPNDMYSLFKDQAIAATRSPGLFGGDATKQPAPAADIDGDDDAAGQGASLIGSVGRLRGDRAVN